MNCHFLLFQNKMAERYSTRRCFRCRIQLKKLKRKFFYRIRCDYCGRFFCHKCSLQEGKVIGSYDEYVEIWSCGYCTSKKNMHIQRPKRSCAVCADNLDHISVTMITYCEVCKNTFCVTCRILEENDNYKNLDNFYCRYCLAGILHFCLF